MIKGQFLGARERKRRGEVSKANAKKVSFDEGLQVLPDTLAHRLGNAVRLRRAVVRVRQNADDWTVVARYEGQDEPATHRAVLYAGTAYRLAQLQLETRIPFSLASFADVEYPAVASVVLGFRREDVVHPCRGFGVLVPRCEGFDVLGTIFSSALFPNRAPAGHLTLTTYLGGAQSPGIATLDESRLVDITLRDLSVLLGVRGRPTFIHTVIWPKAIPQYVVGYGRLKQLMDELERDAPGFFLAGNFRDGVALSDSILAGERAARRIASSLIPAVSASR